MADNKTQTKFPTATGSPNNDFFSPSNMFADDGQIATETTAGDEQDFSDFNFHTTGRQTTNGIQIVIEGCWFVSI